MLFRGILKKVVQRSHNPAADGEDDANMASSPSASSSHSSSMFPSANSPAGVGVAATMSPPETQDLPVSLAGEADDTMTLDGRGDISTADPETSSFGGERMTRADNGEKVAAAQDGVGLESAGQSSSAQGGQEVMDETEPGYLWRNPKAMEEVQKSMDAVVDKGFSLSECRLWLTGVETLTFLQKNLAILLCLTRRK